MKAILQGQEKWRIPMKMISNLNLLLNWDFRNPVNRNGKTEYTEASYTIDCWKLYRPGAITVEASEVTITPNNTGLATFMIQKLDNVAQYQGKKMTLSFLLGQSAGTGQIGVMDASLNNQGRVYFSAEDRLVTITFTASSTLDSVYIAAEANSDQYPIFVQAGKLELGDHQTLASQNEDGKWEIIDPPDYDLQYALCSQYSPSTGEWVGIQHSNRNLLDNWYFIGGGSQQGEGQFPINQRGNTEYMGNVYGIDRWKSNYPGTKVKILNDCIQIIATTSGQPRLTTDLDNVQYIGGKTFTFSILVKGDGTNLPAITCNTNLGDVFVYRNGLFSDWGLLTYTFTIPENITRCSVSIYSSANASAFPVINVKAAKLELGHTQTLAHQDTEGNWVLNDPPPNYAMELLKCQRYYWESQHWFSFIATTNKLTGNRAVVNVSFPVTMRSTPTVTIMSINGTPNILSNWYNTEDSVIIAKSIPGDVKPDGLSTLDISNFVDSDLYHTYIFKIIADANL